MPCHWGYKDKNVVTQSSCTGSQCLSAVGCAEAAALHRPPRPAGLHRPRRRAHLRVAGRRRHAEGEFWESLSTACTLHLPCSSSWPTTATPSRSGPATRRRRRCGNWCAASAGWPSITSTAATTSPPRRKGAEAIARVRAGEGPGLIHATVTRPVLALGGRHPEQVPRGRRAGRRSGPRPDPAARERAREGQGPDAATRPPRSATRRARARRRGRARSAGRARRPDPATVGEHVYVLPAIDRDRPTTPRPRAARSSPSARPSGSPSTSRWRPTSASACSARTWPTRPRTMIADTRGQGRRVRHDARPAEGVRDRPLLQHAAGRSQHRGPGDRPSAARPASPAPEIQFFDYIWPAMQQIKSEAATIRWRSNGAFNVPMVLRVPIGGYLTGGAIWHSQCGESIFAHIPGLLVAFPSRGTRRRRPAAHRVPVRGPGAVPRAQAPACASPTRATRSRRRRTSSRSAAATSSRRGSDLTIVTYGATVEKSRQAAERLAADGHEIEIIDLRTLIPWDQELVGRIGAARPVGCSWSTRT